MMKGLIILSLVYSWVIWGKEGQWPLEKQINCLFEQEPYGESCQGEKGESLGQKSTDKVMPRLSKKEQGHGASNEFHLNFGQTQNMIDTFWSQLGFSYLDQPWGRWHFHYGYGVGAKEGLKFKKHILGLNWEYQFLKQKPLSYALRGGIFYKWSRASYKKALFRGQAMGVQLSGEIRYGFRPRWNLAIGLRVDTPFDRKLKNKLKYNQQTHGEQKYLMRQVENLDENWQITPYVALNYLFD